MELRAQATLMKLQNNLEDGKKFLSYKDLSDLKNLNGETEEKYRRTLMKLKTHGCVEIAPIPNSAEDIQDSSIIKITPTGIGAMAAPSIHGNYEWPIPPQTITPSITVTGAHNVQIGDHNIMSLQDSHAVTVLRSYIEKSDMPAETKKSLLARIGDFAKDLTTEIIAKIAVESFKN